MRKHIMQFGNRIWRMKAHWNVVCDIQLFLWQNHRIKSYGPCAKIKLMTPLVHFLTACKVPLWLQRHQYYQDRFEWRGICPANWDAVSYPTGNIQCCILTYNTAVFISEYSTTRSSIRLIIECPYFCWQTQISEAGIGIFENLAGRVFFGGRKREWRLRVQ